MWGIECTGDILTPVVGRTLDKFVLFVLLLCFIAAIQATHIVLDFNVFVTASMNVNIFMYAYHACLCKWKSEGSNGVFPGNSPPLWTLTLGNH